MPEVIVKIKRGWAAEIPRYQTLGSAGADICANYKGVIEPGQRAIVSTGVCIEVPEGYECQVRPRSGLAAKHGVTILNSPGTIDSDYRGEIKLIMLNTGTEPFGYEGGERLAQLVISPVVRAAFVEVVELSDTDRGFGGLGSTGTR